MVPSGRLTVPTLPVTSAEAVGLALPLAVSGIQIDSHEPVQLIFPFASWSGRVEGVAASQSTSTCEPLIVATPTVSPPERSRRPR